MGCCFSCKKSSSTFKSTRVVHLNGYVEEFEYPVTVSEVTGKLPKHFVCTQTELLSPGSKPLKPDILLQQGHIYFLLPHSIFQSNVSPVDFAPIARKLTAIAKSSMSKAKSRRKIFSSDPNGQSNLCTRVEPENGVAAYGMQKSSKLRSWKPILATIRERSFNRRSESDIQEKNSETAK